MHNTDDRDIWWLTQEDDIQSPGFQLEREGKQRDENGGLTFILDTQLAWQDGSRYYQSYKR